MARQYTAGTATDGGGSSTANMAALQDTLRTIITANAAWSLVETINGTTNVIDVYKCAAASSGLPKDFYFILQRSVSSGNYSTYLAEDYNVATHVASNLSVPWSSNVTAVDPTTGLFNPANTVTFNAATGTPAFGGRSAQTSITTAAATIAYEMIVDTDHLVFRIGASSSRYVGAVESLVTAVADPMPIVAISLSSTGTVTSANSGATRNPGLSAAGLSQTHVLNDALAAKESVVLYPNSGIKDITVSDPWVGGPASYELGAINGAAGNVGAIRGRVKKVRLVYGVPAGTAVGDTFTIAAKQWRVVGVNGTTVACIVDPGP